MPTSANLNARNRFCTCGVPARLTASIWSAESRPAITAETTVCPRSYR
ncbi:MAG: hypothetical protein KA945_06405 [Zoogloea sp.]|nr:hypothetical protein [Zoogloea sp.]